VLRGGDYHRLQAEAAPWSTPQSMKGGLSKPSPLSISTKSSPRTPAGGASARATSSSGANKKAASTKFSKVVAAARGESAPPTPRGRLGSAPSPRPLRETALSPGPNTRDTASSPLRTSSPLRPRSPTRATSPNKAAVKEERDRLQAALLEAQEAQDRESALRMREEAERSLEKVEELWRISRENEQLKAENAALKDERERSAVEAALLSAALASVEDHRHTLMQSAARSQLAIAHLEAALAGFSKGFRVGCSCASGGENERVAYIPNRHRVARSTAAFSSSSPRFGKGVELAMRGVLASSNPVLARETRQQHDQVLHGKRELLLVPQDYVEALTGVLTTGIEHLRASSPSALPMPMPEEAAARLVTTPGSSSPPPRGTRSDAMLMQMASAVTPDSCRRGGGGGRRAFHVASPSAEGMASWRDGPVAVGDSVCEPP
jgi:hypothetical protein